MYSRFNQEEKTVESPPHFELFKRSRLVIGNFNRDTIVCDTGNHNQIYTEFVQI